jgi:1-acyl-sn-glycerol-3-phosphate acyltransferase
MSCHWTIRQSGQKYTPSDLEKRRDWLYSFAQKVLLGLFWIFGGFRALHTDRVPKTGALIVAPNHASYLDPPAAGICIRPLRFMARESLFRFKLFGSLIRRLGAFPVRRGEADTSAIRTALELLAEGEGVLIFPEGSRGDGKTLRPANKGVLLLASRSGAPIVPVGIVNTHIRWPRKGVPRPCRVRVVYGEPFTLAELEERLGREEARQQFGKILMKKIGDLIREGGGDVRLVDDA